MTIKRVKITAQTSGARVVPSANEGYGLYSNEDFYTGAETSVAVWFNNGVDVCRQALDMGTSVEYLYGPMFMIGPELAGAINPDTVNYLKSVIEREQLDKKAPRAVNKILDSAYGQAFNFKVQHNADGSAKIHLQCSHDFNSTLGSFCNRLGVYNDSVEYNYTGNTGPKKSELLLKHLASIGYDYNKVLNTFDIPLDALGKELLALDEEGYVKAITTLTDVKITLHLVNLGAGGPIEWSETRSPYTRHVSESVDQIDNPSLRMKVIFERILAATKVEVYISFTMTAKEVQYVTQTPYDRSNTVDLADWFSATVKGVLFDGNQAAFATPLPLVLQQQEAYNRGSKPEPRTGVLGLMIKPSTLALIKLPLDANNIQANYTERAEVHTQEGFYTNRPVDKDGSSIQSGERVLYVDWTQNVVTVNTAGKTTYLDITEWGPASAWHIRRMIEDTSTVEVEKGPTSTCVLRAYKLVQKMNLISSTVLNDSGIFEGLNDSARMTYSRDLQRDTSLIAVIRGILEQYMYVFNRSPENLSFSGELSKGNTSQTLIQDNYKFKFLNGENKIPLFRFLGACLKMAYDASLNISDTELCKTLGLSIESILNWRANMDVWHTYCQTTDAYKGLELDDRTQRSSYGRQPEDQDELPTGYAPKSIPNLKNDMSLMPHQAKAAYSLEKLPQFAVLDVDAGGGKTLIVITDVLRKLEAGICDTPAVFCPAGLLANYVQDGNFSTHGKLNVIPINSVTVNSFGKEYFEKLAKSGPPNTLFVVSYDYLTTGDIWVSYGTKLTLEPGNAQWIRSLGFDAVWLDESHFLKNASGRTNAARTALVDTKYRVLATGTLLATKIGDVINQMMLLDPGVFGTEARFAEKYGGDGELAASAVDFESGRVVPMKAWISNQMQKNVCVVKGRRKEWAALLPPKKVSFYWVELSEAQRKLYQAVLESTVEEIQNDPKIMALLNQQNEDFADQLEQLLKRFLQRIEKVLTAPGSDELSVTLTPEEKISPKGQMIGRIVRDHMAKNIPGKILVFTSYIHSAEAVYDALPDDIRARAILFKGNALQKMKCREEFEKNPDKILMVGVEFSMNTGINAQFASRLIRCESVYSPGMLEQGESRINRPNAKKDKNGKSTEFRTMIYMDWILVDKSVDVTKAGRLMWRMLDVAKFQNPNIPSYQALPELSPIRMTIESILANNSFEEAIPEYLDTYLTLENKVKSDEVAEYKRRHPNLSFVGQPTDGLLEGSAMLKRVPYTPGGDLMDMSELGLIPIPEYEREYEDIPLKNLNCHTDQGDGPIVSDSKNTVRVLVSGDKITFNKSSCYIITKKVTNAKEIRQAMARNAGLDVLDVNRLKDLPVRSIEGIKELKTLKPLVTPVSELDENVNLIQDKIAVNDVEISSTSAPPNKLLVQYRDNNNKSALWIDSNPVADNKRHLMLDEQQEKYSDYLTTQLYKYVQKHGLTEGDADARLLDMHGHVLSSTDGVDDWELAVEQDYNDNTVLEQPMEFFPVNRVKTKVFAPVQNSEPENEESEDKKGDTRGKNSPVPEDMNSGELELLPCFYNEFFSVIINATDESLKETGFDPLQHGFKYAKPCGYVQLKRWQQAKQLGEKFRDSGFDIPETFYKQLEFVQTALKTSRTHFQQFKHLRVSMTDLRLFQLEKKRKLSPGQVRPFFTVCDGSVFVMIDTSITPSWSKIKSSVRVPGATWKLDDASYVLLADKRSAIVNAVKTIAKQYPVADLDWVKGELKLMNDSSRSKELK